MWYGDKKRMKEEEREREFSVRSRLVRKENGESESALRGERERERDSRREQKVEYTYRSHTSCSGRNESTRKKRSPPNRGYPRMRTKVMKSVR